MELSKMDNTQTIGPPDWAARAVGALTPYSLRAELLEHLGKRYRSLPVYVRDAARAIHPVVVYQARCSFDAKRFIGEACWLFIAFAAGAPRPLMVALLVG